MLLPYHFDDQYREIVTLEDGSRVLLRCVQPGDKVKLVEGLQRLSPRSRYTRFFTAKPYLTEQELKFFTEVDGVDHFAMGALKYDPPAADDRGDGVGIVRFKRLADHPDTAEPAIVVLDEEQGKGLGRLLFCRLIAAAAERGIRHFQCVIMAQNDAAVHMIKDLAPNSEFHPNGTEVLVRFPLPDLDPEPVEPPTPEHHGPLYHVFRFAAAGEVFVRSALSGIRHLWEGNEEDRGSDS